MKKLLKIAVSLLLVFGLTACKKNVWKGNTTAKVYLLEQGTDDGINGGEVYLYGGKLSGSGLFAGESLTLLETYTTDEDGYVFIDFKHKDYKDEDYDFYTLRAYAARYYVDDTEYDLKIKEDNEVTIKLVAEATLRVHVKNVNKEYDKIRIQTVGGSIGDEFSGDNVDEYIVGTTIGNQNSENFYILYKGNETEQRSFEVYCPAHEVTEYTIEY